MKPAARVVPNVPSFSVDAGFWYSIPDHLIGDLDVGSIVRVPLGGRRVRGWVVELDEREDVRLKDIAGVSSAGPVFDVNHLKSLQWAANHYVTPISALLSRASPPNLPRETPDPVTPTGGTSHGHGIDALVARSARGLSAPVTALIGNWRQLDWIPSLLPVLSSGRSVLLIAASVAEARRLADAARAKLGSDVVAVTGVDDKADTRVWETAQSPPRLVMGTPKIAAWQIADLGLAVVLEESRRAMKDRQTPTIHVRDLMITRRRVEGFNLAFFGPTPGVEILAGGADVVRTDRRAWPLVEIVDRSDDLSGYLSRRTMAAIEATAAAGRRTFVFTHRRIGYASSRCARCRTIHTCPVCGSRLGRVEACTRCGEAVGPCTNCGGTEFREMGTIPERLVAEINRKAGRPIAAVFPEDAEVRVGTERDLAGIDHVFLAVAADVDGMLVGSSYRTAEDALRQLARLALVVGQESGSRLMLQTGLPDSLLVATMRRGDPIDYLERVLVDRAKDGLPPSAEMIAVEIRGSVPQDSTAQLRSVAGEAVVMGPIDVDGGKRWLLTGKLGKVRIELRNLVGHWRDLGATVRIDVDPIDV